MCELGMRDKETATFAKNYIYRRFGVNLGMSLVAHLCLVSGNLKTLNQCLPSINGPTLIFDDSVITHFFTPLHALLT